MSTVFHGRSERPGVTWKLYKDELKKLEIDLARFRYTRLMDAVSPLQKQLAEISEIKADTSH